MTAQSPNPPAQPPAADPPAVVSRHLTSEGMLLYLRTPDGRLQARLHRWSGAAQTVLDSSARSPVSRAC